MFEVFKAFAKSIFTSKKFLAMFVGLLATTIAPHLGASEAQVQEHVMSIAAIVSFYLVGQGLADHGKERTKVEMEAALTNSETEAPKAPTNPS